MTNKNPDYPHLIETLAKQAHQGCGLSYELFSRRFQSSIDNLIERLPEEEKGSVIAIAVKHGYEREQPNEDCRNDDERCCSHGIDIDCCPAGCADYD
ncbi:hypothetical protein D0812_29220 (plasmid) [Vibrio owensii]|uniref:Plasmid-related protein n=4 Tax=Vibrio harveyi group TaxID=717610 RepID=A0AAX1FZH0_VIBPH|nr:MULTISPECIES: hypothetical protein [Vibrio harveyi group]AYO07867.1 hypothetical protein D0871_26575 [Vibrio parahaemolyticus]AYO18508.1 hypothetical protein D0812_29220 [Vibrio owensii]MBE3902275.1 hypothetical protein [Vibrio parahaemolyticus]MBE4075752.1 hypothetical protein [Vibrio parahaemolyticus]MBE4272554.1 hypothetical protein [Vibrio parahaemolyticus]